MEESLGFCIRCRKKIPLGTFLCNFCGGACSSQLRFSATEEDAQFCHRCGESGYMSLEKPFCELCVKKN